MSAKTISNIRSWHDAGYTGAGIKVLVAEPSLKDYHAKAVQEIIKIYAPGATILEYEYETYQEEKMIDFAIFNKVDIINTSYGVGYPSGTFIEDRAKKAYAKALNAGIFIINSAGNAGTESIKSNGLIDDRIINVGMCDNKLRVPIESSYTQKGDVDCCGLVGHKLKDGTILWGTSEAAPYVSGLLAVLLSKNRLNLAQVIEFINKHSLDLEAVGRDIRSGAGLFILPHLVNDKAVEMVNLKSKKIYVHRDYVHEAIKKGYKINP